MDEPDSEAQGSEAEANREAASMEESKSHSQKFQVTPEQRRFFGGARSFRQPSVPDKKSEESPSSRVQRTSSTSRGGSEPKSPRRARGWRISTPVEVQKIMLVLAALMLLGGMFYVGKKYEYWKYLIETRKDAKVVAKLTGEFAGATPEELVENAIAAEQVGRWDEAAKRLIAAKYKNPALGGVIFRAGKLYYDHSDFESADRLFESSIGFGENIDAANYYRGMIASARSDFPAAERFFEAATNAAPLNADYYYSLAETLRKDHRPKDSIFRYEQAMRRSGGESEQTICRFKMRMAELEAGDLGKVGSELEQQQARGTLAVDWMITAAALEIQEGHIEQAVSLVEKAREADQSRLDALFAACVSDRFFSIARQNRPELTQACNVGRPPGSATPGHGDQPPP